MQLRILELEKKNILVNKSHKRKNMFLEKRIYLQIVFIINKHH